MNDINLEGCVEGIGCENGCYMGIKEIYEDNHSAEVLLADIECPECGRQGEYEVASEDGEYRCTGCGYEGNMYDDIAEENYFWEEALCSYDEEERGEVFDGFDD